MASFTVTNATNATPIVITTSVAHGLISGQVVRIENVVGNTAANGTWHITVIDTTRFSIAYASSGDVPGNGAYTSGGTVVGPLGSVNAIVGLISSELVKLLADRNMPALTLGRIVLGSEKTYENVAPPYILFVPDTSDFAQSGYPQVGGTANVATIRSSPERMAQLAARALMQESLSFRIHVWGQADPPDSELDYDATRDLYHALIKVIHDTSVATFTLTKGTWAANNADSNTQMIVAGREMVFGAVWRTPVLDTGFAFVDPTTTPYLTTKMRPADGSADEIGCQTP